MDARNEILDAVEIMISRAMEKTTKIYSATCVSVVGNNRCVVVVNGVHTKIMYYGNPPLVNHQYRVFVPEGNMSNAFMITGENKN